MNKMYSIDVIEIYIIGIKIIFKFIEEFINILVYKLLIIVVNL